MRNQTLVHRPSALALAAAAVVVLTPSAAGAAELGVNRAATKTERAAIARVARVPARCVEASVSARRGHWAAWSYRLPATRSCARSVRPGLTLDTLTFVRRSAGRWRTIAAVSDCGRPKRVPVSVYRDIGPVSCVS